MDLKKNRANNLQRDSNKNERGASMLEYAFLALLIALLCIAAIARVGEETTKKFEDPELINAFNEPAAESSE